MMRFWKPSLDNATDLIFFLQPFLNADKPTYSQALVYELCIQDVSITVLSVSDLYWTLSKYLLSYLDSWIKGKIYFPSTKFTGTTKG